MGVQFDASVNIGNIITIILGIVSLTVAWTKLGGRLQLIEYRVKSVEDALDKIASAMITLGKNETTLAVMQAEVASMQLALSTAQAQIEGLRRGEGYIQNPRRGNIDGEYSRSG